MKKKSFAIILFLLISTMLAHLWVETIRVWSGLEVLREIDCSLGIEGALAANPVANAGSDQSLKKNHPLGRDAFLAGTNSFDPDGDPLTYHWYGPFPYATGAQILRSRSLREATQPLSWSMIVGLCPDWIQQGCRLSLVLTSLHGRSRERCN